MIMKSTHIGAKFLTRAVKCALVLITISAFADVSHAQNIQRIAATVNDDVVSEYDLRSRLQVLISSTGLRPTQQLRKRLSQQVLRSLVDEKLQLQAAKKRNIKASKRDMNRQIAELEKQNKIPPGSFDSFLKKIGIPSEALMAQIHARITWQKFIGRTISPRVTVGEDEVDEILERLRQQKGQTEYRVSEILLYVDQPQQENEVRQTAQRLLEELRKGAKFTAIARQFSQSASASVGGDLGWIQEATISDDLRKIVSRMKDGETVGPVRTPVGIQIVHLNKKRKTLAGSPDDTVIELQQLLLPLGKGLAEDEVNAQVGLAQTLSDVASNCKDHLHAAGEAKSVGATKLGKLRLGNLSKTVRSAVENLAINKASPPIRTSSGVAVYMVCSRKEAEGGLPTRKQISDRLRNKRVAVLARRYLRDLRAAAIVDLRV
jgi:peptidyl-prolyl cis-trans isomerase SurA